MSEDWDAAIPRPSHIIHAPIFKIRDGSQNMWEEKPWE
jgi:hypothetical protein